MARCPYCKNLIEWVNKIKTEVLVDTPNGWKLAPVQEILEVRCPFCQSEFGDDDLRTLGIPQYLLEEEPD